MRKIKILAVLLSVMLLLPACGSAKKETRVERKTEPKDYLAWTPVYNDHQKCGVQINRPSPEGMWKETMTEAELRSVVPEEILASFDTTGTSYFKKDNTIYNLVIKMPLQEGTAVLVLGNDVNRGACCYSVGFGGGGEKSKCGTLEYAIFRRLSGETTTLEAFSKIAGIPFLLRVDTKTPENNKIVFERILEAFARTKADTLTLSEIKPN